MAGGWHYHRDSHLDPARLLSEWRRVLESQGSEILEQCELTGFVRRGDAVRAAITRCGEIAADGFVVATGAWTPLLARALGCRVPVQPGKGYSRPLARPLACPQVPIIFQGQKVAVTPLCSGLRFGSTMEFSGYDASLNPRRLAMLTETVKPLLRMFDDEPAGEERAAEGPWYGWRPMTFDTLPIIDRVPNMPGVLLATGHNMLGLTLAAATGKLVMELLSGRAPHLPAEPYSLSRFQ